MRGARTTEALRPTWASALESDDSKLPSAANLRQLQSNLGEKLGELDRRVESVDPNELFAQPDELVSLSALREKLDAALDEIKAAQNLTEDIAAMEVKLPTLNNADAEAQLRALKNDPKVVDALDKSEALERRVTKLEEDLRDRKARLRTHVRDAEAGLQDGDPLDLLLAQAAAAVTEAGRQGDVELIGRARDVETLTRSALARQAAWEELLPPERFVPSWDANRDTWLRSAFAALENLEQRPSEDGLGSWFAKTVSRASVNLHRRSCGC